MQELNLRIKLRNNIYQSNREVNVLLDKTIITKDSIKGLEEDETLVEVEIPSGVEKIDSHAFDKYKDLEIVKFPDSLQVIGFYAFGNCNKIKNLTLPSNIKKIDYAAFFMLDSMVSITISKSLKTFYATSFGRASIQLDSENPYYWQGEDGVIYNTNKKKLIWAPINAKELKVLDGTEVVVESSLSGLSCLKKIELPESITSIEKYSFCGCQNLEVINIPKKLKSLEDSIFENCGSLKEIEIPSNILKIEAFAFLRCNNIKKIIIPKTVKEVSFFAFCFWTQDQTIVFESRESANDHDFDTDAKIVFLD